MNDLIQKRMNEKNISQNQLAKLVGVKQQYISKIILGQIKSPSFNLVVKIADALDISLDELREKREQCKQQS